MKPKKFNNDNNDNKLVIPLSFVIPYIFMYLLNVEKCFDVFVVSKSTKTVHFQNVFCLGSMSYTYSSFAILMLLSNFLIPIDLIIILEMNAIYDCDSELNKVMSATFQPRM